MDAANARSLENQAAIGMIWQVLQNLQNRLHTNSLTDSCEVLISGIPLQCNMSDEEVIAAISNALTLTSLPQFIVETRQWSNTKTSDTNETTQQVSPASSRQLVIKLCSARTRDFVLSHNSKLAFDHYGHYFSTNCGVQHSPLRKGSITSDLLYTTSPFL